jgi:hypothetical protein
MTCHSKIGFRDLFRECGAVNFISHVARWPDEYLSLLDYFV